MCLHWTGSTERSDASLRPHIRSLLDFFSLFHKDMTQMYWFCAADSFFIDSTKEIMFYIKDLSFLLCVVTTLLHPLSWNLFLFLLEWLERCLGTFYPALLVYAQYYRVCAQHTQQVWLCFVSCSDFFYSHYNCESVKRSFDTCCLGSSRQWSENDFFLNKAIHHGAVAEGEIYS